MHSLEETYKLQQSSNIISDACSKNDQSTSNAKTKSRYVSLNVYKTVIQVFAEFNFIFIFNNRKRQRDDDHNQLFKTILINTFTRMPIDLASSTTSKATFKHFQQTLDEYNKMLFSKKNKDQNGELHEHNMIPPPSQIADWALVSFSAIVLHNASSNNSIGKQQLGIQQRDDDDYYHTEQYQNESNFVKIVMNPDKGNGISCVVADAIHTRLTELLGSLLLDVSKINMLCLARFLSHLNTDIVMDLFTQSIQRLLSSSWSKCCDVDGMNALAKLFATFVSIVHHQNRGKSCLSLDSFESALRKKLGNDQNPKQSKFLDLLFTTTKYLTLS